MNVQIIVRMFGAFGVRKLGRWVARVAVALAVATSSGTALAASGPTIITESLHRDGPFLDCPEFTAYGAWDVTRRITVFTDPAGVAVRDIWPNGLIGQTRSGHTTAVGPRSSRWPIS